MYIKELVLEDFRNYLYQELVLSRAVTVLTGGNAQGKTNVLEALYLLATGRSHRTADDSDLVRTGQEGFRVRTVVEERRLERNIEAAFSHQQGRRLSVGGKQYRKLGGIQSGLNVVLFAPEDLDLIKGPPANRRRFLDDEIFQASSIYRKVLGDYNRCLSHRNRLLKEAAGRQLAQSLLDPWNQRLAEAGVAVTRMRGQVIRALAPVAGRVQERLAAGAETLQLTYCPSGAPDPGDFLRALEEKAPDEFARGVTLVGPHRDELYIELDGKNIRTHGSQGQQRCAVLALKTAVMEHLSSTTGSAPVLLLDDILSELDASRQRELLSMLDSGSQTVITSAGEEPVQRISKESTTVVYRIMGGSARRVH
ncbi:MAG: DNA replication/repair protein RecF [Bacillota bacterium]